MNRILFILLITFFAFPSILFSQKIKTRELKPFVEIENGNYREAIDSLELIIKGNKQPEFYLALIKANYKIGRLNEAIGYCNELDKIQLGYASEYKIKIYLQLNDFENAKAALNENLKSRHKLSLYSLLNDQGYATLSQEGIVDSILSTNNYSKTEKQLYQAERLIQSEKYMQALFVVNEILSRNSAVAQTHYFLSLISYSINDKKKALESINAALELRKSNREYLRFRILLNDEYKKFDAALQDINKIIRLDPYNINNYIKKADLLFKTRNFEEAINLTEEIVKLCPNNSDVLYLGSKSNFKKGEYLGALKLINSSLQLKSTKESFELRGDIYTATNTFEYAIRDYSMFLDIEPYNGDVYAKKGFARLRLGDKKGACADWLKAKRYGSYDAANYLEKYCE